MLCLTLMFMLSFTVLAFGVAKWQSNDIVVSIVSDNESEEEQVNISILNTAGISLLFPENNDSAGVIEYLDENNEWIKVCDISYSVDNPHAVSKDYAGMFAELNPGEKWEISISEEAASVMKNGSYRVRMTYTTVNEYENYIDELILAANESDEVSIDSDPVGEYGPEYIPGFEADEKDDEITLVYEEFIKEFEYKVNESKGDVSIDESDISNSDSDIEISSGSDSDYADGLNDHIQKIFN